MRELLDQLDQLVGGLEQRLKQRLDRLESAVAALIQENPSKELFTTGEAAALLNRKPWTVREWCRLGRINAEKRACGRGRAKEYCITKAELDRISNHGLLPLPKTQTL